MSLPSCREIRNQLFLLVGTATAVLATTTVILDDHKPLTLASAETAQISSADLASIVTRNQVNWDDVNLSGQVNSPEDEVKTARGKLFGDFEAR